MMFANRFDHTMTASANRAEAPSACAHCAGNRSAQAAGNRCAHSAIALILDATVVASIFVALITLISLLVLAVLLIANQLNRCKRPMTV